MVSVSHVGIAAAVVGVFLCVRERDRLQPRAAAEDDLGRHPAGGKHSDGVVRLVPPRLCRVQEITHRIAMWHQQERDAFV